MRLHLSKGKWAKRGSGTGYEGVSKSRTRFVAAHNHKFLGTFDTAVEAAVVYARAKANACRQDVLIIINFIQASPCR